MISVVMPVYNEERNIIDTLTAIYNNTVLPDEVIMADGGSSDKTVDLVKEKFPQVIIVDNPKKNAMPQSPTIMPTIMEKITHFADTTKRCKLCNILCLIISFIMPHLIFII